jgi:hypothetical protein
MMFSRIARASVQPLAQCQQRRTFLNWMTNYPDRVSEHCEREVKIVQ